MNSSEFRKELLKVMPGYSWTVHRSNLFIKTNHISATGIQTAGFNRLSTLSVTRRKKEDEIEYDVKSSGFGKQAPWLSEYTAPTLARALRGLQSHYEVMANKYSNHASALEYARKKHNKAQS